MLYRRPKVTYAVNYGDIANNRADPCLNQRNFETALLGNIGTENQCLSRRSQRWRGWCNTQKRVVMKSEQLLPAKHRLSSAHSGVGSLRGSRRFRLDQQGPLCFSASGKCMHGPLFCRGRVRYVAIKKFSIVFAYLDRFRLYASAHP